MNEQTDYKGIIEQLAEKKEIRTNLSQLRKLLKDNEIKQELIKDQNLAEMVVSFLKEEDPKIRKNAVLLLGDLQCQSAVSEIMEAYEQENTMFVKASYVTALCQLDTEEYLSRLKKRLEEVMAEEATDSNRKHLDEERRALQNLIIQYDGITTHVFKGWDKEVKVILQTNPAHREVVRKMVSTGEAKAHGLGVEVKTNRLKELMKIRMYRDLLFILDLTNANKRYISNDPVEAAKELWNSNLYVLLEELHEQTGPFYFRVECKSAMTLEERSSFTRRLTGELERLSGGNLVNSTSDYEVELRVVQTKTGEFYPALKLYTIMDKRFTYRKNSIATSIHPSTAALIMEMAKPYLTEEGQIIDPFCGVGTMLIERDMAVPAREMYGTDTFGEAIVKARENALLAGERINYIHRDFFDFKHEYKFDEIVTNMPVRGKKTKEEMDRIYELFFAKASSILTEKGIIVMYTNEVGFVKKQLRLHKEYHLLQETLMQKKGEFYLLIIEVA